MTEHNQKSNEELREAVQTIASKLTDEQRERMITAVASQRAASGPSAAEIAAEQEALNTDDESLPLALAKKLLFSPAKSSHIAHPSGLAVRINRVTGHVIIFSVESGRRIATMNAREAKFLGLLMHAGFIASGIIGESNELHGIDIDTGAKG